MLEQELLIQERFFRTIQGEGAFVGFSSDFIRLGGCNVGCSYCDTGYAAGVMQPRSHKISIADLVEDLVSPICVVTGGEPFIQPNLPNLVDAIIGVNKRCHIETSGTVWQDVSDRAWITLSPKERSTGLPVDERFWSRVNELKLIICNAQDLEYYIELLPTLKITRECQIFFQPEYSNREEVIPLIVSRLPNLDIGVRLSIQTHKYIGVL